MYAVIDLYDGGMGDTVVSRHRTLAAAIRRKYKLQRRINREYPNAISKYRVIGLGRHITTDEYWDAIDAIER